MPKKKLKKQRALLAVLPVRSARQKVARKKLRHVIKSNRSKPKMLMMHPLTVLALLIAGVVLTSLTVKTLASDYSVTATVEAALPQLGATITNPKNNSSVTTRPITVSGTCSNDSYVKLTRNSTFSGVAICDNGVFSIESDLFLGVNDLQAQAYNVTNQAGPVTPIVQVIFQPSVQASSSSTQQPTTKQPATTGTPITTPTVTGPPLLLQSDYQFNAATTNQKFEWKLKFQYAAPPVKAHIDWGDGTNSSVTVKDNGEFKIQHQYKDSGYYKIKIQGTDANRRTVSLQLVAFIRKKGEPVVNGTILPTKQSPLDAFASKLHWLLYVWPTFGLVAVIIFSFWLGERRELLLLTKHKTPRHRVRHT